MKYVVRIPSGFVIYFLARSGRMTALRSCAAEFYDRCAAERAAAEFNRQTPNAPNPATPEEVKISPG